MTREQEVETAFIEQVVRLSRLGEIPGIDVSKGMLPQKLVEHEYPLIVIANSLGLVCWTEPLREFGETEYGWTAHWLAPDFSEHDGLILSSRFHAELSALTEAIKAKWPEGT